MDVYGFVAGLKWFLGLLALLLGLASWALQKRGSGPGIRAGILVAIGLAANVGAGLLQWLVGLESAAGWWNLVGPFAFMAALLLIGRTARADKPTASSPAPKASTAPLVLLGISCFAWLGSTLDRPASKPHTVDLRRFDPDAVAELETAMWRSYYDRERLQLFLQLRELMQAQYHFPRLAAFQEAYLAARAAFLFKEGRDRSDYERALPYLQSYYQEIR